MNILVPTDFSQCADYALDAACKIAKKAGGKIHLYNAAELPDDWEDLGLVDQLKDDVNLGISRITMDRLKEKSQIVKDYGLDYQLHYTGGKFLENIQEILDKVDISLIVMGSKGISGKSEWFIGSNAQKVIRHIHCNILVIKDKVETVDFSNVLFASSLTLKDKISFEHFLNFIKPFNVKKIHLLAVDTFGFFSQPTPIILEALKDFKNLVKDVECFTHFISDYSVDSGIRNFSNSHEIELIGISNNTRNPLKRIFQGSNVEMLVNHADVPVLGLDHNK